MPAAQVAERMVTAHSEVKRACDLLIAGSPEALDSCQDVLQLAVSELTGFRSRSHEIVADSRARSAVNELRAEILRAAGLLQSLSSFYRGWERILGSMSAGYTAGGDPAPVTRNGRVCCRG